MTTEETYEGRLYVRIFGEGALADIDVDELCHIVPREPEGLLESRIYISRLAVHVVNDHRVR